MCVRMSKSLSPPPFFFLAVHHLWLYTSYFMFYQSNFLWCLMKSDSTYWHAKKGFQASGKNVLSWKLTGIVLLTLPFSLRRQLVKYVISHSKLSLLYRQQSTLNIAVPALNISTDFKICEPAELIKCVCVLQDSPDHNHQLLPGQAFGEWRGSTEGPERQPSLH